MNIDEIADALVQKIISIKSVGTCLVTVKKTPNLWFFSKLKRNSTTKQEYNNILNPDIEFTNSRKKDVIITEIHLIPDATFKEKGMVKIFAGDVTLFENETAGDFTDVVDLNVEIKDGLVLKRDEKVTIFFISNDGSNVSLTVQVTLGEK